MRIFFILLLTIICIHSYGSDGDSSLVPRKVNRFLQSLNSTFSNLDKKLEKSTDRMLERLQKQEDKLYRKLKKTDSLKAEQLFAGQKKKYAAMRSKLAGADSSLQSLKEYNPSLDTFKTSLAYLDKYKVGDVAIAAQLQDAKAELKKFESRMQVANELKRQIKERREQLKQQLQQTPLAKQLVGYQKEVYYYNQQIGEYKAMLKDRDKAQKKALSLLRNTSQFKDFMKKYSGLAQLFKVPDNYGTPESLAGLQTRSGIEDMLKQRLGAGPNAQQLLQQQMQAAQGKLKELKDKVNKLGSNGNADMPEGFKPNSQKTKKFLERIEYGMNVQSTRANGILPSTSDVALTAGYKLNDGATMGIGISYKLGWGRPVNHISLSHEGIGLRSYIDYKIKGNFWLSGGYEQNYNSRFGKFEELKKVQWQQSGLIGLTKKYKIGKKTQNIQLLWDFLNYKQSPKTQPSFRFRVGWVL